MVYPKAGQAKGRRSRTNKESKEKQQITKPALWRVFFYKLFTVLGGILCLNKKKQAKS